MSSKLYRNVVALDAFTNSYIVANRTVNNIRVLTVAKRNRFGDTQWAKEFPLCSGRNVAVSDDQNIYVTGTKFETNGQEGLFIKLNVNGDLLWQKEHAHSSGAGSLMMDVAPNGDVVAGVGTAIVRYASDGSFVSSFEAGGLPVGLDTDPSSNVISLVNLGQQSTLMLSNAPNGTENWRVEKALQLYTGVVRVSPGGYVTFAMIAEDQHDSFPPRVIRLTLTGQEVWEHRVNTPFLGNAIADLEVDSAGYANVAWQGDLGNGAFLSRISPTGSLAWNKYFDGNTFWLALDRHGLLYLGGTYVYKIHPQHGNLLWTARFFETNGQDASLDGEVDPNGQLVMAGLTSRRVNRPEGGTEEVDFTIRILSLVQRPEAINDVYYVNGNTVLFTNAATGVKANDRYAAGFPVVLVGPPPPSNGFTLKPDGSFELRMQQGFSGELTFQYKIEVPNWTTNTATVTIRVHPILSNFTINPNSVTGGESTTGTVTLAAPAVAGGTPVAVTDNSGAITTPANVVVPAGQTTANFTIQTSAVGADVVRSVTVQRGEYKKTANLTILSGPATLTSFGINPSTLKGGTSTTGTVNLTKAAPAGGVTVTITDNSSAVTTSAQVVVPEGSSQASFQIGTSAVTQTYTRQVTVSHGSVTKTASITITP